ncbi:hypothetical protein [Sphaerisporangium corydalis]|uniref:MarR family transcriptional regulator n=1 Tax=Sphaerisporangium corydalis TaxID=1441875 RepID=A0ABV9E9W6_9ACTN|nr:hypothetical protein [Sphaerisporangium corydalis]
MPDEKLSLPQMAALLVLMREVGEVSNTQLKERYGLTLTGKPRTKLNDAKLVESWKQGQTFVHRLTDDGWARLGREIGHGVERPAGSAGSALVAVLGGLHVFMERTGNKLADIFAPVETAASLDDQPSPVAPVSSADPEVEARIRAAYARLGRPGSYVGLAELRAALQDLPRTEVDAALRAMNRLPDVNLVPESNQKALKREDREAAVTIGDQDKHVLWIGA